MQDNFHIEQFEDKPLSHYSYAVLSNGEIAIVDPARDITPYLDFAAKHKAQITAVIETHPHADFVSGHLELHEKTGAVILVSKLVGAGYQHVGFDEADTIKIGSVLLKAMNTPGHSPDGISIVLEDQGKDRAVFTGDTLFIGDCGRPDLRESAGNQQAGREALASQMYHTLRDKFLPLLSDVIVYPAHGAGTLCGKNLSSANSSTMGAEKISNWSLQPQDEATFKKELLADQPFVPAYFPFDVELNKNGAPALDVALSGISFIESEIDPKVLIVDTRDNVTFSKGHEAHSFNIQEGGKFETWLGSIIQPGEAFYLAVTSEEKGKELLKRVAKIGYEAQLKGYFVPAGAELHSPEMDHAKFVENQEAYTIIDVRNRNEVKDKKIFPGATNIPLADIRSRIQDIPADKPIVVHCAGGYRSAAGSSIIAEYIKDVPVYDFGEAIKDFQ